MKFLDLFAGIGGFRLGLEKAGHTCEYTCVALTKHKQKQKQILDDDDDPYMWQQARYARNLVSVLGDGLHGR